MKRKTCVPSLFLVIPRDFCGEITRKETKMRFSKNVLTRLTVWGAMVGAIALQSGIARAQQAPATGDNKVTAIDILLEPDATMVQRATAANAELLKNFPEGYTLGGEHAPHVSMLQRYVYTAELDKVFSAASKCLRRRTRQAGN
jgi:hypothetical protein